MTKEEILIESLKQADPVLMQMWALFLKCLEGPKREAA